MNALFSLSDINIEIDGEPRLRDLTIADRLGYERPRDIRELIKRNLEELGTYGAAPYRTALLSRPQGGVVQVDEYWLNEPQSLLICMFSKTDMAAEVRRALIELFLAWRRGELPPAPSQAESGADPLPRLDLRMWHDLVNLTYRVKGQKAAARLLDMSPLPQPPSAEAVTVPDDASAAECLEHLLCWEIDGTRTVADLLAAQPPKNSRDALVLRNHGIWLAPRGRSGWIAVSNTLAPLNQCFNGTAWAGGGWRAALIRLSGAQASPYALHYGATCTRAVLIPPELIRQDGAGADMAAEVRS